MKPTATEYCRCTKDCAARRHRRCVRQPGRSQGSARGVAEQNMKRCIVFGGAGFLGAHIIPRLCGNARLVVCVDRFERAPAHLPAGCAYVRASEKPTFFAELLQRGDEVVDLAYSSVPKTSYEDPVSDILENLPRLVKLCRAATANRIGKIVMMSSGGAVYGKATSLPISEDCPTNPVSPYGITKLAIEKYAQMYHVAEGLPVICLRPGNAYGAAQLPFRGQGFIATAIASVLSGIPVEIFGESGTIRDYIHAGDIASLVERVLDVGAPGSVFNVGTGRGTSNLDIISQLRPLAASANLDVRLKTQPSRPFDVTENVLDSSRAKQATGWGPTTGLEEGLAAAWNWYASNHDKWAQALPAAGTRPQCSCSR